MKKLVVVERDGAANYNLTDAVRAADGDGSSLVVLHVMDQNEYNDRRGAICQVNGLSGEGYTFTIDQAEAEAAIVAERTAWAAVGNSDVEYDAVGAVGPRLRTILRSAAEHDCEEIVVPETSPRWWGLFGHFDRSLTKGFDGTVTRVPAPVAAAAIPVPESEPARPAVKSER